MAVGDKMGVNSQDVRPQRAFAALLLVGACASAEALGAAVTFPEIKGWYAALEKPSWTPPNEVFGPVWTGLYIAMAAAAWLVWCAKPEQSERRRFQRLGLVAFWVQLAANAAWSPLFFRFHALSIALVDILLLLVAIGVTTALFAKVSRTAALLMAPYFAWTAYAAALNGTVWSLNS